MNKKPVAQKPPYGSFKTARSFIDRLKRTVVPDHIDRGMMKGMSGDSQTETLSAFRFLKLVGEKDSSEESLRTLVASFGTDRWSATLADVITTAYTPIIADLKLKTASAKMLTDRFRSYGLDGFMLARCIRFYLAVLKESQIEFSPLLKAPTVKKSKSASQKSTKRNEGKDGAISGGNGGDGEEMVPESYEVMPLPPGRKFIFPPDLNAADVTMITAVLNAYAARREETE